MEAVLVVALSLDTDVAVNVLLSMVDVTIWKLTGRWFSVKLLRSVAKGDRKLSTMWGRKTFAKVQ
jgi:hypothetical protein